MAVCGFLLAIYAFIILPVLSEWLDLTDTTVNVHIKRSASNGLPGDRAEACVNYEAAFSDASPQRRLKYGIRVHAY